MTIVGVIILVIVMEAWGIIYNRPKTLKHVILSLLSWPFQLPSVVRRWRR